MWLRGKRGGRWQELREADFWPSMTIARFRELRTIVKHAYTNRPGEGAARDLGFVPRTFAVWALSRAGVDVRELGTGADAILRSYALYQTVQVSEGTWEAGPTQWHTLPTVYRDTDSAPTRRARFRNEE